MIITSTVIFKYKDHLDDSVFDMGVESRRPSCGELERWEVVLRLPWLDTLPAQDLKDVARRAGLGSHWHPTLASPRPCLPPHAPLIPVCGPSFSSRVSPGYALQPSARVPLVRMDRAHNPGGPGKTTVWKPGL